MNEVCSKDSINWMKYYKNIWIKIEVEKEIERRGDNIGKINFWITRKETEKILYSELHF